MALVIDTGPLLAALDADDEWHPKCVAVLEACQETLVVPAPVLVEIDYWIRERLDLSVWRSFAEDVGNGAYRIFDLDEQALLRVAELEAEYADLDLGMVDASVIVTCERLDERKVATIDRRHFGTVQPRHCQTLHLLPD